jgi:hypothetical protein
MEYVSFKPILEKDRQISRDRSITSDEFFLKIHYALSKGLVFTPVKCIAGIAVHPHEPFLGQEMHIGVTDQCQNHPFNVFLLSSARLDFHQVIQQLQEFPVLLVDESYANCVSIFPVCKWH